MTHGRGQRVHLNFARDLRRKSDNYYPILESRKSATLCVKQTKGYRLYPAVIAAEGNGAVVPDLAPKMYRPTVLGI
jgi:hypothetical protein